MSETPVVEAIGTLYLRGSRYSWKVKVPSELSHLPHYRKLDGSPKQNAADVSLKTTDKSEALTKATTLAAEWSSRFAAERRALEVQCPGTLLPAMVDAIAQRVKVAVLAEDDRLRDDAGALAESLSHWWATQERARKLAHERALRDAQSEAQEPPPYRPRAVPRWLTQEGREELKSYVQAGQEGVVLAGLLDLLKERHQAAAQQAKAALGKKNTGPFLVRAEREAMALGVNLGADAWVSPQAKPLRDACQRSYLEALESLALRDGGDVVTTPPAPAVPTKATEERPTVGHKLSEVFDKWKDGGDNPSPATIRKKSVAVRLYESFTKDAPIETLTMEQGGEFAGWLLKQCKAEKTAKDHLDSVKSLLNKATKLGGLGWLSENPWQGHTVKVKQKATRKPWRSADLVKLFDSPLFHSYALPTSPSAGGAAAYWCLLLVIYTGARQSDLCQLRVSDIEERGPVLFLHITAERADEDEGTAETTLKSEASRRCIPVHPELIRLGFSCYWRDTKDAGHKALFPEVRRVPGQAAGVEFSRWFLGYRREQGVDTRWQDFHAFRHTASTRLMAQGVTETVSDFLTGHAPTGQGSAGTYRHAEVLKELPELQARLQYPELSLSRVYPVRG